MGCLPCGEGPAQGPLQAPLPVVYVLMGVTVQVVAEVMVTRATRQKSLLAQLPEPLRVKARLMNVAVGVVLVVLPQKICTVATRPAARA